MGVNLIVIAMKVTFILLLSFYLQFILIRPSCTFTQWQSTESFPILGGYTAYVGSVYRRFGTTYRFHLQGSVSNTSEQQIFDYTAADAWNLGIVRA